MVKLCLLSASRLTLSIYLSQGIYQPIFIIFPKLVLLFNTLWASAVCLSLDKALWGYKDLEDMLPELSYS